MCCVHKRVRITSTRNGAADDTEGIEIFVIVNEYELRTRNTNSKIYAKECEKLMELRLEHDDGNTTDAQEGTKGYWAFPALMRGDDEDNT